MARDERLSLRDVQIILGHAHLSTTADIYLVEEQSQVIGRVREHLAEFTERAQRPVPTVAAGYAVTDLDVLFDPRQKPRLLEIIGNLRERIAEARAYGWLGEVEGLQTSLNAAKAKLANLNRAPADGRPQLVALGMPTFTGEPANTRTASP